MLDLERAINRNASLVTFTLGVSCIQHGIFPDRGTLSPVAASRIIFERIESRLGEYSLIDLIREDTLPVWYRQLVEQVCNEVVEEYFVRSQEQASDQQN